MDFDSLARKLEQSFIPENAKGIDAKVQLRIEGEGIEDWLMEIHNSTCKISRGQGENPRVTVQVSGDDLRSLLAGQLDPMVAFFSGRVQVKGDRGFLMKMGSLFSSQGLKL